MSLSSLPRHEFHRKRIHTMTTVGSGKAFSNEYVAQMAAAVHALYLRPLTIRIWQVVHGSWYLLIKGRPATMSIKLVDRAIKLGVTSTANIDAFLIKVVVLTSEGRLGSLRFDYVSLFRREWVVV